MVSCDNPRKIMPRMLSLLGIALPVLMLPAAGMADFSLAPGFPWSYSVAGSETATDLDVDMRERVWVAGNVSSTLGDWNVLVQIYSVTETGGPMAVEEYDDSDGGDEGPPALVVGAYPELNMDGSQSPEAFVAYTSPVSGPGTNGVIVGWILGIFAGTAALDLDWGTSLGPGGQVRIADIERGVGGTPYVVGSLTEGSDERLLYFRRARQTAGTFANDICLATLPIEGPAASRGAGVAVDGYGNSWAVAGAGGSLCLYRFTLDSYPFVSNVSILTPEVDWTRPNPTATADRPSALVRSVFGDLWVAGSVNGSAAIWRFDPEGALVKGFPVIVGGAGASSTLYRLALDARGRCLAAGAQDGRMLFAGVDKSGGGVPGLPITVSATELAGSGAPAVLEGRAIGFAQDGSVWIAATARYRAGPSASAAWGSYTKLFLYTEGEPVPTIPAGAVVIRAVALRGGAVARGGQVVNLARNETLEILVHPRSPGRLRVRVLTMRGELINESWETVIGGQEALFTWDGRTAAGTGVAAGTYAIHVAGAGVDEVRRVVVMRKR